MAEASLPEDVKQFIFVYIDSVEQLEVLFRLRESPGEQFTAEQISRELRSSPSSVGGRMDLLCRHGLIDCEAGNYSYKLSGSELDLVIGRVLQEYRLRRQKIFELIFSPSKRVRQFADAFIFSSPDKFKKDDSDG